MLVLECCFFFGVTKFDCIELQDIGEHLTTIQLSCCDRGKRCLYEGSAPPGGFPNSWVCFFFLRHQNSTHFMIQMYTLFMLPTFVSSFYASWNEKNGASYCTSDLTVLKNNEIHLWDRGFDDDGNQVQSYSLLMHSRFFLVQRTFIWSGVSCLIFQVWGPKEGPYEFKPAPSSSSINNDVFSPLNIFPQSTLDKPIKGSFILQE